jgi:hypothetical protein
MLVVFLIVGLPATKWHSVLKKEGKSVERAVHLGVAISKSTAGFN